MPPIRVALRVPVGRPLPDLATFIARCEDAGLDGVGIHDHPSSGRDAYLALALAAQATQRLRLFAAGPRMIELAGEVADGAFLMVGLHPASVRAARLHLETGAARAGRSLANFPVVFVTTFGLGDAQIGAHWIRSWFAPGQPFLN